MKRTIFAAGTRILAVKDIGPVSQGHIGVVTEVVERPFLFWKRPYYLCTFLGNVQLAMKPRHVFDFDHGRSLQKIQMPLDSSVVVAAQASANRADAVDAVNAVDADPGALMAA